MCVTTNCIQAEGGVWPLMAIARGLCVPAWRGPGPPVPPTEGWPIAAAASPGIYVKTLSTQLNSL